MATATQSSYVRPSTKPKYRRQKNGTPSRTIGRVFYEDVYVEESDTSGRGHELDAAILLLNQMQMNYEPRTPD